MFFFQVLVLQMAAPPSLRPENSVFLEKNNLQQNNPWILEFHLFTGIFGWGRISSNLGKTFGP